MFRFATSGSFTSNFAGENAGLIARALSSFKGRIKEHLLVVVNTENMKSLSALDHRRMEKFLYLVRPPMRVHQLISRSDIGQKKYYLNLSCHQPHLAFLVSQLIPHQMLSQSHSRCALIDYSERLFRRKMIRWFRKTRTLGSGRSGFRPLRIKIVNREKCSSEKRGILPQVGYPYR